MISATDQEGNEIPLNLEWPAGKGPEVRIGFADVLSLAHVVTVDQTSALRPCLTLVASHAALFDWARTKRRAAACPPAVGFAFEVLEDNIRAPFTPAARWSWFGRAFEEQGFVPGRDAIAADPQQRLVIIKANGILQPAPDLNLNLVGAGVLESELQDGGRQG